MPSESRLDTNCQGEREALSLLPVLLDSVGMVLSELGLIENPCEFTGARNLKRKQIWLLRLIDGFE